MTMFFFLMQVYFSVLEGNKP